MANFEDVHRKQLYAADRKLCRGEIWSVALREPLRITDKPVHSNEDTMNVVGFELMPGGKLEPAHPSDYEAIADWKRRHQGTPLSWFDLPEGLPAAGQPPITPA